MLLPSSSHLSDLLFIMGLIIDRSISKFLLNLVLGLGTPALALFSIMSVDNDWLLVIIVRRLSWHSRFTSREQDLLRRLVVALICRLRHTCLNIILVVIVALKELLDAIPA